jgi:hypothetical protein
MKTAVAVTLIVAGAVVVAIPPLSDAWRTLMVTRLMEHGATSVNLEGRLEDLYRCGCWLLGAVMIAVGAGASWRSERDCDRRARGDGGDRSSTALGELK